MMFGRQIPKTAQLATASRESHAGITKMDGKHPRKTTSKVNALVSGLARLTQPGTVRPSCLI